MLIEQAKQVQRDTQALSKAYENQKKREQFHSRHNDLSGLAEDIMPLAHTMEVITSHGVSIEYDGENLNAVISEVRDIREKFDKEPHWIIRDENDLSDLKRWVRKHRKKIERKVQSAWSEYYREKVPELNSSLLDALGDFEDFSEEVQTVRQCTQALQRWKDKPPETKEEFDSFETFVERRSSTWQELKSDELSEEILEFLIDAGSDGATPTQYTEEVQSWLAENDLLDRVRIHL